MQSIPRRFVLMSLVYLALGVLGGLAMAGLPAWIPALRFLHFHLLLLGFMCMMVFGVAYHVLPRFNARPLPWPALVPIHFYLMNSGLWGMLTGHAMWQISGSHTWYVLFEAGAAATGLAVFLFVVNMIGVLGPAEHASSCDRQSQRSPSSSPPHSEPSQGAGTGIKKSFDENMALGPMIAAWPRTLEVLERYFGKDCFSCHGLADETAAQSAALHNVDLNTLMADLRRAATGMDSKPPPFIDLGLSLNETVALYPKSVAVFQKLGMDSCCGGAHSLRKMCQAKGVAPETLVEELRKIL